MGPLNRSDNFRLVPRVLRNHPDRTQGVGTFSVSRGGRPPGSVGSPFRELGSRDVGRDHQFPLLGPRGVTRDSKFPKSSRRRVGRVGPDVEEEIYVKVLSFT